MQYAASGAHCLTDGLHFEAYSDHTKTVRCQHMPTQVLHYQAYSDHTHVVGFCDLFNLRIRVRDKHRDSDKVMDRGKV